MAANYVPVIERSLRAPPVKFCSYVHSSSPIYDPSTHSPQDNLVRALADAENLLVTSNTSASSTGGGSQPSPSPHNEDEGQISDQEWEIRTGRAIYLLQQTLPDFFTTGLVSSLEVPVLRPPDPKNGHKDPQGDEAEVESIYARTIRLAYTPPVALPTPFPRTLHIEGLHLYMASAAFVRHTLNALYTDLRVELRHVRVHGARPSGPHQSGTDGGQGQGLSDVPPGARAQKQKHRSTREKSLAIGLAVSGVARVSGAQGGWEVNSTYVFSPLSGLIHEHRIDSIEPAPHQAVFDALRKLGLAGGDGVGGETPGAGAARAQGPAVRPG